MEAYKTLLTTVTPARFKVGQMIGATGLLLGVALAMYRRVDADKKDKYRSMFISTVLAVFLTGVTEPLEFMFMFIAIVYCLCNSSGMCIRNVRNHSSESTFFRKSGVYYKNSNVNQGRPGRRHY